MPQMKPLNWLILMLYTLMIYVMTNNFLYFFYHKNFISNKKLIKNYKKFNFKW